MIHNIISLYIAWLIIMVIFSVIKGDNWNRFRGRIRNTFGTATVIVLISTVVRLI